jgi:putative transposase
MQEPQLRSLAVATAQLWNMANYQRRQAYFKHRKIPNYSKQCRKFKHAKPFKTLGTCKAQANLKKLHEAWASTLALKRLQRQGKLPPNIRRVCLPGYLKDRKTGQVIAESIYVRNDGYKLTEDTLSLGKGLAVRFKSGDLWVGKQGRLQLHYDILRRKWYGHIPLCVKWPRKGKPHQPTPKRASIDLGICNLATCVVEGSKTAYLYSGRAALSDWRYWTKRIAKEQEQLARVNGKRTSKALGTIFQTRKRRLHHAIDAMLRDLFERLEAQGVTELVVGDLKHIRDNADHGGVGNQKLHNFWPFAQIRQRIQELGEEYSLRVRFKSERSTSKRCSICGQTHQNGRIRRGLYRCEKTRRTMNADVNGALNILYGRKVAALSGSRPMARPLLLKWDSYLWKQSSRTPTREARISWL